MNEVALARKALASAAGPVAAAPAPAGALKRSVITAFCHDCRTPLAVIADSASIVREELEVEGADPESIEFLNGITQRAIEIEDLLSDLRFLHAQLLESPEIPAEPASFTELLGDVAPQLDRVVSSLGHTLNFKFDTQLPSGWFDAAVLARAISASVTELCRPPDTGATLSVAASVDADGKWVNVTVRRSEEGDEALQRDGEPRDEQNREPAEDGDLRFRLQVAATLVRLFGGKLVAEQGSAHRALTIRLPVCEPVGAGSPDRPA